MEAKSGDGLCEGGQTRKRLADETRLWPRPRFSLESDADLDQIPHAYVDGEVGRMRCSGNRCKPLRD